MAWIGRRFGIHPDTGYKWLSRWAGADERGGTVRAHLETTFRRYGLPDAMFVDNGGPWGDAKGVRWTRLSVWLLKLGVEVLHGRPYHPQSRGKNERFHRTLAEEVFALRRFQDLAQVQRAFAQAFRHGT